MTTRAWSIDDLSDEIIALVIYHLEDPGPLSRISRRFYQISSDPYIRSSYFLERYGPHQAFFFALSRGKLVNTRVLENLYNSGAHFSRYLLQVAIHHYFRTTAHFIKSTWVRSLPLPVFTHFMNLDSRFGAHMPIGKGEDDGSVFQMWLKERSTPGLGKKIELDTIKELFTKYGFMIFAPKDPLAAQLPLAFALEPTLLPLAIANGFNLEPGYRNFIFRRMFQKQGECLNIRERANEIVLNVRELTKVDKQMFLSRTVAAEICMECRTNQPGYLALKILDEHGDLLYPLRGLVHDLLKLFLKTRSITSSPTILILQTLYQDFAPDFPTPAPRFVVLITIFCTPPNTGLIYAEDERPASEMPLYLTLDIIKSKLEYSGLLPLTRDDLLHVLISPWCQTPKPLFTWANVEMGMKEVEMYQLAEEAVVRSLEVSCKGKFMGRVSDMYEILRDKVQSAAEQRALKVEDLPCWLDGQNLRQFSTGLNAVMKPGPMPFQFYMSRIDSGHPRTPDDFSVSESDSDDLPDEEKSVNHTQEEDRPSKTALGRITQDTLSHRIHIDSEDTLRSRRRYWHVPAYMMSSETDQRAPYPSDSKHVALWVLETFGAQHPVTAIFMDHAVANNNHKVLEHYLSQDTPRNKRVPITFKHFQIMAKLGIEPCWEICREVEHSEFYFSEEDYLLPYFARRTGRIKLENESASKVPSTSSISPQVQTENPRKRPRRSTTFLQSYIELDSDEDDMDEWDDGISSNYKQSVKKWGSTKPETSLQTWIKHLSALLREEEKKYKEKRQSIEKDHRGKPTSRLAKSNFMKALASLLPEMRETDRQRRIGHSGGTLHGFGLYDDDGDNDDDDFCMPGTKRRRRSKEVYVDYYN